MKTNQDKMNLDGWELAKGAKSISYFASNKSVKIDKQTIEKLKQIAKENGEVNARLCLHSNPEETLHDMVILAYQDRTCRKPHKHLEKDETIHMIEGTLAVLIFDEEGKLIEKVILEPDNKFVFRTTRNTYHVHLPVSKYVIYKETKQGPFKQEDNIPPKWNYIEILKEYTDFMDLKCNNISCKTPCLLNIKFK